MKRIVILITMLLLTFAIIPAYGRGTLQDKDAFSTYMGLSKNEVQKIARAFDKSGNGNTYKIDQDRQIMEGQNIFLAIIFNDNDIAETILLKSFSEVKLDEEYFFIKALEMFGIDYYRSDTKFLLNVAELDNKPILYTDDYVCQNSGYSIESDGDYSYSCFCSSSEELISQMKLAAIIYPVMSNENTHPAHQDEDGSWTCENGHSGNVGAFCGKCGAKKPERLKCSVCGFEPPIGENPLFCQKCGTKFDQPSNTYAVSNLSSGSLQNSSPTLTPSNEAQTIGGLIDPDLKSFLDSYESYIDKYVEFMKKYSANPADLSLLLEYTSMISELEEFSEAADKYDAKTSEMSAADFAYYMEVMTRINKKLMTVY